MTDPVFLESAGEVEAQPFINDDHIAEELKRLEAYRRAAEVALEAEFSLPDGLKLAADPVDTVATLPTETVATHTVESNVRLRLRPKPVRAAPAAKRQVESARPDARVGKSDDFDIIKRYLREIGQYPLLTKDDEERLSAVVMDGLAAQTEAQRPRLTPAKLAELNLRIVAGGEAKKEFVQANLRLVVSIAKRRQNRGLLLLDLIQEGNIGLAHAVDKFDGRKGFKFSTYGTWWIKQSIDRAIANQARIVRLPVHTEDTLIALAMVEHQQYLGGYKDDQEIADNLHISTDKLQELRRIRTMQPVSLDESRGEDGGATIYEVVGIPDTVSEEAVQHSDAEDMIRDVMQVARRVYTESELALYLGLQGLTPEDAGLKPAELAVKYGVKKSTAQHLTKRLVSVIYHPTTGIAAKQFEELAWQAEAECRNEDFETFFPTRGISLRAAQDICRNCVVREECDSLARRRRFYGVWSSVSTRGRRPNKS